MMFGSILSATDPVAVVALLKDLGRYSACLDLYHITLSKYSPVFPNSQPV